MRVLYSICPATTVPVHCGNLSIRTVQHIFRTVTMSPYSSTLVLYSAYSTVLLRTYCNTELSIEYYIE